MGGITRTPGGISLEINGMPDHLHMLVRLKPIIAIADFLRETKSISSGWIRRTHESKFRWQRRYGAFTVSESVSDPGRYIKNQKEHHKKQTFEDEYKELLRLHRVEFDEEYLWG